jgi:hypothetical protein
MIAVLETNQVKPSFVDLNGCTGAEYEQQSRERSERKKFNGDELRALNRVLTTNQTFTKRGKTERRIRFDDTDARR